LNVQLDLVGSSYRPSLKRLKEATSEVDPSGEFIVYHGSKYGKDLREFLHKSDGFVFSSSCETFGQVLLEAMAASLPIACSNIPVAREMALDCAEYFDPEDIEGIANAMQLIMINAERRHESALCAAQIAKKYSPEKSANDTFKFICAFAREERNS